MPHRRIAWLLAALVLATGCAGAPVAPPPGSEIEAQGPCPRAVAPRVAAALDAAPAEPGTRGTAPLRVHPDFVEVRVFYGTNRRRTASCDPASIYGAVPGPLETGEVRVTVPRDHRLGALESPSIWRLEFAGDPAEHVMLASVDPIPAELFHARLADAVARSVEPSAFVFVHGFNVPFEEAARRTAQIAYDLKFPGTPILFSWPSQGSVMAYVRDREVAAESAPALAAFLAQVSRESGARTVHLIAHSMGNQVLAGALQALIPERDPDAPPLFQELVLAAPDVDAVQFEEELAAVFTASARRVTLYASARDRALRIARDVLDFPRAGDLDDGIVLHEHIETVDASAVDTSFVGHSYYGDNRSVMSDLFNLLRERQPAGVRFGLVPVETARGTYWRFQP